jgi:hypothetical protein
MKKLYSKPQMDAVMFASSDLTNAVTISSATTLATGSDVIVKTADGKAIKLSDLNS